MESYHGKTLKLLFFIIQKISRETMQKYKKFLLQYKNLFPVKHKKGTAAC